MSEADTVVPSPVCVSETQDTGVRVSVGRMRGE